VTDRFVDANIFVRHITNDDPIRSPASRALFQAIRNGHVTAWTTDLVAAEVVFVLSSKRTTYNMSREAIRDALLPLLLLPGLDVPSKTLFPRIFDYFVGLAIDYIDAYHAVLVERRTPPELYSYDFHFDRVTSLRRIEP